MSVLTNLQYIFSFNFFHPQLSNFAMQHMIIMGGTNDNTNSKESITHSGGQAKYVASGCQQDMQEKSGISSAMQALNLQKTKVSGQDVLHSNSASAGVAVI